MYLIKTSLFSLVLYCLLHLPLFIICQFYTMQTTQQALNRLSIVRSVGGVQSTGNVGETLRNIAKFYTNLYTFHDRQSLAILSSSNELMKSILGFNEKQQISVQLNLSCNIRWWYTLCFSQDCFLLMFILSVVKVQ